LIRKTQDLDEIIEEKKRVFFLSKQKRSALYNIVYLRINER